MTPDLDLNFPEIPTYHEFKNAEEIMAAVRNGKSVFWATENYQVKLNHFKNGEEQWLIICTPNNHAIGLTHLDGETLNGLPEEFFTA